MQVIAIITGLAGLASAAAIERATTYQAPQGKGDFLLQVIATNGDLKYSGQFLNTYHSGAGSSVLVVSDQQEGSNRYQFNKTTGQVSSILGSDRFYLSQDARDIFAPPTGYKFIGYNDGGSDNHYHFTVPNNELQFGPSYAKDIFAVCPAVIYTKDTYIPTLVYRSPATKANPKCADVKVKAIF